ncbi:hypothetical protein LV779_35095 [Streptomyces thinghirensis]|nr:hypothetical protein [Streptomyces thinghirensis]
MDRYAIGQALLEQLPPPLPADRIIALNQPKADLHTTRSYEVERPGRSTFRPASSYPAGPAA